MNTFSKRTFSLLIVPLAGLLGVSPPPAGATSLIGIGHTYEVTARDGQGRPVQPARPYNVTVTYSINQAAGVRADTLALYFWDGASWRPEPTGTVEPVRRVVAEAPDYLSRWAVLGQVPPLYVPLVMKGRWR